MYTKSVSTKNRLSMSAHLIRVRSLKTIFHLMVTGLDGTYRISGLSIGNAVIALGWAVLSAGTKVRVEVAPDVVQSGLACSLLSSIGESRGWNQVRWSRAAMAADSTSQCAQMRFSLSIRLTYYASLPRL
jgi:hypothetical protein